MRKRSIVTVCLLPAVSAVAWGQYVGKVGQANLAQKPVLRATAVYQYTGSMTKPNASRLVPVVIWDGTSFQPGGLYLAHPEPLSVAPGTQYVLMPHGVPTGLFDVVAASQLNGAWVGLGRYAKEPPPPAPRALRAHGPMPVLLGGEGEGRADEDEDGGPVLHRHAGSEGGSTNPGNTGTGSNSGGPTLHRRDNGSAGNGSDSGSTQSTTTTSTSESGSGNDTNGPTLHRRDDDTAQAASSTPQDPDRPVLHEGRETASAAAPDSGRPVLHERSETTGAAAPAPDPNRPVLRYGSATVSGPVLPAELEKVSAGKAGGKPVEIAQVVAISDVANDEPHDFAYEWSSPEAKAAAVKAMHALALHVLASAISGSFGPQAEADREVRDAAAAEDAAFGPAATKSVGHGAHRGTTAHVPVHAPADPLLDPEFHAYTLSYGGGSAWIYSAHTRAPGAQRRYVTLIAQPDFYGKPQVIFSQTTRGDMLDQTPALHLVDAVDADGDHRAELLFTEQTQSDEESAAARQFALFRVVGGDAREVYSTGPLAQQ